MKIVEQQNRDYKEELRIATYYSFGDKDNRAARQAMSDLSKEGIIFIPMGKRRYVRVERAAKSLVNRHLWSLIRMLRTTYINRIKPLEKYLSEEQKQYLYDGDLFKEGERYDI